jgi:ABC-type polysaccharide/polyol phosphate transport system ATPase subunit
VMHRLKKSLPSELMTCKTGKTLIVVSHALGTIQELCTDVVWLDHGNLIKTGKA